jgi:hypothetical protein
MLNEINDPRLSVPGKGAAYECAAGCDLGNGVAATVVVTATRNGTAVVSSASSVSLLAANVYQRRYAATIINNGTTTLYLGFGTAAVVGTGIAIPAGASWSWLGGSVADPANGNAVVTSAQLNGAINGIWAGSPTGSANIVETVV